MPRESGNRLTKDIRVRLQIHKKHQDPAVRRILGLYLFFVHYLDCSHSSIFSRIPIREKAGRRPAHNKRLDGYGVVTSFGSLRSLLRPCPLVLRARGSLRSLFLSRALSNREAVNSLVLSFGPT